jgi:CO/xanthine dehydrogenase Mo-binding subunit
MFVGRDLIRLDAVPKVTGKAQFSNDMRMEGMLFCCVLRSTRPHALIKKIDPRQALARPGVVAAFTARDIPGKNIYGAIRKDQLFLADEKVRCVGEPILLLVGETEDACRKALDFVTVDYEEIGPVTDPMKAGDSDHHVHSAGNLLLYRKIRKGDVEKGFGDCDVIVEETYTTTWVDHAFMETEAGIGYIDEAGRIVVRSSTQNIHTKRAEVANLLNMPEEKIRMIQATTGGGFGGKLDVTVEGFLALAVYHLKRPVMMHFTREESFLSNTKRHPLYIEYKMGAKKDGSIAAAKVNIIGDTGPYGSYGDAVCLRSAVHATGPYEVPNVHVDSRMFYTNNPVSGAFRGFGIPQLAFAHESQLDEIASLLDIDPFDIRVKNALKKGSRTATSQYLPASAGLVETLRKLEPAWRTRKKEKGSGFGLGCMFYGIGNTGAATPAHATVELSENGKIILHTGASEIGQGADTVLMQILMETLQVRPDQVELDRGDTATSRDSGSCSASRQTYTCGGAVVDAAVKFRTFLELRGYYRGKDLRDIYLYAKDESALLFDGFFSPAVQSLTAETGEGIPYPTYAFASHMTEVAVDESTGECRVKRVWAAHDVGRSINPRMVKGQIYGGVAMGIGMALMEAFDPLKTVSLDTYYLPTAMDMPEVHAFIVEEEEPTGPYGAKGVGEPALIPQAASIMNALKDAVGVRAFELPCDIERLKLLIEKKKDRS